MKKIKIAFIAVFLLICVVPSLGLAVTGLEDSSENRDLAEFPALRTEEGWNVSYLSELGAWYEDHFAFRNELVTGYSLLCGRVFGTSAQESVIVGTDGWLYYKDSLSDYQGSDLMTDRQLFDTAHTLAMIQTYAEENGIAFLFTIAPNKASLYGEHMPYYYSKFRSEENNLSRLLPWLAEEGVHYADLYEPLAAQEEVLYHERDSHWNNRGASLAADVLLTALGQDHRSYENAYYEIRTDFEGDLDGMVYPTAVTPEAEIYYDPEPEFTYVEEVESNYSAKISTLGEGTGSLVVYRDSFCNALLPFLAESYGEAYFSRGVPYQLASDLAEHQASALIVERAERFLPEIAEQAPVMPGLLSTEESVYALPYTEEIAEFAQTEQGPYTKLSGTLTPGSYEVDSRIYIRINDLLIYEAFPVSLAGGEEGFELYVPTAVLSEEGNRFELGLTK